MAEAATPADGAPAVSVIIPAYNRARWLPQTVASALGQTLKPLEIVIIDDGSTDDTPEVCAAFPEPVRYIRQPRAGVAAARNRGAAEARGQWLAFLDSDDLWAPDKLRAQLSALDATGATWSITDCEMIDLDGRPLEGRQGFARAFPMFREIPEEPAEFFARHFRDGTVTAGDRTHTTFHGDAFVPLFYGNFASPAAAVVDAGLFQEVGGFDTGLEIAEDTEFFHRIAAAAPLVIVMTPLLRWRTGHTESLVTSDIEGSIRTALGSLERAAVRRGRLSPDAERAYRAGRRSLLHRLGYWQLSVLDVEGARHTLTRLRGEGYGLSLRWLTLRAGSLLPRPLLSAFHRLKRRLQR